jgi:hypothetical protein
MVIDLTGDEAAPHPPVTAMANNTDVNTVSSDIPVIASGSRVGNDRWKPCSVCGLDVNWPFILRSE